MQTTFEVLWSGTAENDLLKIIKYIAQDSPGNAFKILEKIKKKVADPAFFPEKCRIVPELYNQGITLYREMVISQWRVQYRIADSQVFVLSVLDSRQNIEGILLKRFTQHII